MYCFMKFASSDKLQYSTLLQNNDFFFLLFTVRFLRFQRLFYEVAVKL